MANKNVFNRGIYYNSQREVKGMIKEILPDWGKTQGFILDGIRHVDTYEKQSLKVLVLLGESYGYGTCNDKVTIEDLITIEDLRIKTINKVGALLWLIFESIEKDTEFSQKDFPNLFKEYPKIKCALLKSAWVNVKKESNNSGVSRQNYNEICEHAKKNEAVLRKQIKSIAPDLIIVCSNPVIESVINMHLLSDVVLKTKNVIHRNSDGQKIIHVSHPSYYRDWGYKSVFETYKIIYNTL